MLFAIDKWQLYLLTQAFDLWRTNAAQVRRQRRTMRAAFASFEKRQREMKLKKCFLLWKIERVRTRRTVVAPQVVQLTLETKVRRQAGREGEMGVLAPPRSAALHRTLLRVSAVRFSSVSFCLLVFL